MAEHTINSYSIDARDEAGTRALGELRDRGSILRRSTGAVGDLSRVFSGFSE